MSWLDWLKGLLGGKTPIDPPPPPPVGDGLVRLINLHNEFRAAHGKPALAVDARLMAAAQAHASDMAKNILISHTGSDGSSMVDRMHNAGYYYSTAAENIAYGQKTPAQVMAQWEDSPMHRADILGPYRHIGVGRSGDYWCVDFGSPA